MNPLTLILPLLGRHKLTDRILSNLEKQNCEFKIIIADGSESPYSGDYKNLDVEYFYNGFDDNISQFMNKMHCAMQRVETPLCMTFDNDDLIDLRGIRNGISFLSDNKEYSTYRNDIRVLHLGSKIKIKESIYTYDSIEQENSEERLSQVIRNFNSFSYAIFRTPIMKCTFEILDRLKNKDFQLYMKSWAYIASIFGKCKRLHNESYYYFIPGHSVVQTGKIHKFSGWVNTDYWETSCPKMVSIIGNLHEHIYDKDVRDFFCKHFMNEICRTNSLENIDQNYIDTMVSESHKYDSKIQNVISKYSFDFENVDYSVVCPAKHEDFTKELSSCLNM